MIKSTDNIELVKESIKKLHHKKVDVVCSLGRNKIVKFQGELTGVYPALFKIEPIDKNFLGRTTYSYQEYMCKRVKIKESKSV